MLGDEERSALLVNSVGLIFITVCWSIPSLGKMFSDMVESLGVKRQLYQWLLRFLWILFGVNISSILLTTMKDTPSKTKEGLLYKGKHKEEELTGDGMKTIMLTPRSIKRDHTLPNDARKASPIKSGIPVQYYGTPLKAVTSTPSKSQISQSVMDSPSSHIPSTGSPWTDRAIGERLAGWTEQLKEQLVSMTPKKVTAISDDSAKVSSNFKLAKISLERKMHDPEETLRMLGLGLRLDEITERVRIWFIRKIIAPLAKDIREIDDEFGRLGLDHLGSQNPATFSLFAARYNNGIAPQGIMFVSGSGNSSRPQTLLELAQREPNNRLVQTRLRIERFLSFASLGSQRAVIIRRLREWAECGLNASWRHFGPIHQQLSLENPVSQSQPHSQSDREDENEMLMHLFCTFLDEHLPSEEFFEAQAFSARHFVALEEQPSDRSDTAVQIQQVRRLPSAHYQLIAGKHVYQTNAGSDHVFRIIAFFIEYVHRTSSGYLGIGNLGSPIIDLLSVLL